MLMNYQSNQLSERLRLEEALNAFSDEIWYLTLKDGRNIEIIQSNQFEKGYNYNQFENEEQYNLNDEFIEEKIEDDSNNINYGQIIPTQLGPLRGRGPNKKVAKALK